MVPPLSHDAKSDGKVVLGGGWQQKQRPVEGGNPVLVAAKLSSTKRQTSQRKMSPTNSVRGSWRLFWKVGLTKLENKSFTLQKVLKGIFQLTLPKLIR